MKFDLKGLVAATFTPMHKDGSLNLDQIKPLVDHLVDDGISGLYVNGSTGEAPLLTAQERMAVAEAYIKANDGRLPAIIHIGHESTRQARDLAAHAQAIGADAIAAVPPTYFGIDAEDALIDSLAQIAAGASQLPFFYYHVPRFTGVELDLLAFLDKAEERLPTFVGVKFTSTAVHEFQSLLRCKEGQYIILYGLDEMHSSALSVGGYGAIGATYNFAAPLYHKMREAHKRGDVDVVARCQALSVEMIRLCKRRRAIPAFKAIMGMVGPECGPTRPPLQALQPQEVVALRKELDEIGFFQWARKSI